MQDSLRSSNSVLSGRDIVWLPILFLIALFLISWLIRATLLRDASYTAGEVLSEKIDHLQDFGHEYDVIFLGTSHVYRSIDPQIFDRTLGSLGYSVRSYNAGVFRLGHLEAERIVDVIEMRPPATKSQIVIVEPSLRDFDFANWSSERELYTHTAIETLSAVSFHWRGVLDWDSTWLAGRHAIALVTHVSSGALFSLNYGRASSRAFPGGDVFAKRSFASPPDNGFLPLDRDTGSGVVDRGDVFGQETFDAALKEGRDERARWRRKPMASTIRFYARLTEAIESAGGKVAFVATPRISGGAPLVGDDIESLFKHPPKFLSDRTVGDYRDQSDNAINAIFESSFWFDPEHLNEKGAMVFTEQLAKDLAKHELFRNQ